MNEIKFKHVMKKESWSDFTNVTELEETITSLEVILRNIKDQTDKVIIKRFSWQTESGFEPRDYKLKFIPITYTKIRTINDQYSLNGSYYDSIRALFHISSPFVLITGSERIMKADIEYLLSMLSITIINSEFPYPIFFNIPLKTYLHYIGIQYSGNQCLHFYSQTHYQIPDECEDFNTMQIFFNSHFGQNADNLAFSAQYHYSFDFLTYPKSLTHTLVSFNSNLETDPVESLNFYFEWPYSTSRIEYPSLSTTKSLLVIATYLKKISRRNPLHSFIKRKKSLIKNDNWKVWTASTGNPSLKTEIEDLFSQESAFDSVNESVNKSAPIHSLLGQFAILVANYKTLSNYVSLWTIFVQELRKHYEQRKSLPCIETSGPNFGNCILYQKIQMINYCITCLNSPNNVYYAETEDQAKEAEIFAEKDNANLDYCSRFRNRKIRAYIAQYKKLNQNASLDQFIKNYPCDIDFIQQIWNNCSLDESFNPNTQAEIALDYIECMMPLEAYSQLVNVMLNESYNFVKSRIPPNSTASQKAFHAVNDLLRKTDDPLEICKSIEDFSLVVETFNSLLAKIPNYPHIIDTLFNTHNYRTNNPEEIQMFMNIFQMIHSDLIQEENYIFTGDIKTNGISNMQFLQISKQHVSHGKKAVISSIFQETL